MKKLIAFTLILFISFNPIAKAQGQEGDVNVNAGITPDSILYPVDKLIDEVKVALTTDDEKKIETIEQVAQERLAEAQVMAEENKEDLTKQTVEEFQEK